MKIGERYIFDGVMAWATKDSLVTFVEEEMIESVALHRRYKDKECEIVHIVESDPMPTVDIKFDDDQIIHLAFFNNLIELNV